MFEYGMMETYCVTGDPVGWLHPGMSRAGKRYDRQKAEKLVAGIQLRKQHGDKPFFQGPLYLQVDFYVPLPESWTKAKKKRYQGAPVTSTPDNTNYIKYLEDAATGILFTDDRIIYHSNHKKIYDDGNGPRTEFTLTEHIYDLEQ